MVFRKDVMSRLKDRTEPKSFHPLPLLYMATTNWPTKHTADFSSSTFPHSLHSPSPPFSHHICLSALRVKDREGQEDMQGTILHQSGDRESLCQLNGMCLCRKSHTHVLHSQANRPPFLSFPLHTLDGVTVLWFLCVVTVWKAQEGKAALPLMTPAAGDRSR